MRLLAAGFDFSPTAKGHQATLPERLVPFAGSGRAMLAALLGARLDLFVVADCLSGIALNFALECGLVALELAGAGAERAALLQPGEEPGPRGGLQLALRAWHPDFPDRAFRSA